MKNFDTNGKRGRWRARQWAALAGLCLAGTLFGNAEAFAEGAGPPPTLPAAGYPLIIPAKNEPVVTEFSLLKSWDFQGGNYSLIKAFRYSTDPTWKDGYLRRDRECRDSARKAYYILKNYDSESKVVFQCSAFDREIVDVIPCDRTWFLILTNLDAQRNFMGEFPMNRLEECEKKAEVWNPEVSSSSRTLHPSGYDNVDFGTTRYFSYGESRGGIYTRHFSSDVDLPRFGRLENRGLYKQPWKFSWDGKSLIARPVGQRITQLKDVDFYRYDPDKKTWTPHNRDESEKTELSAVHSKSPNREDEDDVRNFRKRLEVVDRTEKVSRTEIDEVKRAFAGVDKAGSAPVGARILVFDGETPTTTDVLLLLSRQCNYTKCPNVCVEDEEYFYAWREGDFRHGTLVDRKNLSVRTWSFRDGTCVLYW